jgi:hypothetical protein
LLAAGLVVFAAVYAGFGFATGTAAVWPLFALYGCYMAATDGVARALVADLSPEALRATAQGTFRLLTGSSAVVASIVAGVLWSSVAPGAVFALGAGAAIAGLVLLSAWSRPGVAG